MDGIFVQDSDWTRKLSQTLYSLLRQKVLCDLGIVCSPKTDVCSIKSNEIVLVHRCVLSAASETIRHLSVGSSVYNLVKINGVHISTQCWNAILEFVYCGSASVNASRLCELKKASQVLQIKRFENEIDEHHDDFRYCSCNGRKPPQAPLSFNSTTYSLNDDQWLPLLYETMLDFLVNQTLCNMTIITEKTADLPSEISAHLCVVVGASSTIRDLVLQGAETFNSVKIDSISYNTWLYLLEYIYTSRVSIVKSNIGKVWIAAQLLRMDGLANAVSPFATEIVSNRTLSFTAVAGDKQGQSVAGASVGAMQASKRTLARTCSAVSDDSDDLLDLPLSAAAIKSERSSTSGDVISERTLADVNALDILNGESQQSSATGVTLDLADVDHLSDDKTLQLDSAADSPSAAPPIRLPSPIHELSPHIASSTPVFPMPIAIAPPQQLLQVNGDVRGSSTFLFLQSSYTNTMTQEQDAYFFQ